MSELLKKITDKLEAKATKFGFKGTDSVHVSLVLTEDEQKEFSDIKWDAHYSYEIKNNVLHMNHVEELVIYCEQFEKKYNVTKLEKRFGKFRNDDKAIYQIEDACPEKTDEGDIYKAFAIDDEGILHFIIWQQYGKDAENKLYINEAGKAIGNCSNPAYACNWDNYKIEKVVF